MEKNKQVTIWFIPLMFYTIRGIEVGSETLFFAHINWGLARIFGYQTFVEVNW